LQLVLLALGYVSARASSGCSAGGIIRSHSGNLAVNVLPPTPKTTVEKKRLVVQKDGIVTRGGSLLSKQTQSEMIGVALFVGLDVAFRRAFKALGIAFPSQLGGCVILFTLWTLLSATGGNKVADFMVNTLTPGAGWLAKFLPVFFVPGLAMLPVAPSVGSFVEVLKYLSIILVGFFYTLSTTVYAVEFVDGLLNGKRSAPIPSSGSSTQGGASKPPFTAETLKSLLTYAVISGAISIAATNANHPWASPVQAAFLTLATVSGFVFGSRLPDSVKSVVHPLVTSTVVTLSTIQLLSVFIGQSFTDVLKHFRSGSMDLFKLGAGDLLLFMLGPSVVSFSIPMYARRKLVKDNLPVILTSVLVSSVGGLFGTAFYVRLIQVASKTVRLSVLPRFVTTPLAIAIATMLEGNVAIAAAAVVLSGITAGTIGRTVLDNLGIKSPIARGLALGAAGQGIGVASLVSEKDAFPFAAVSMVMTAVGATTLISIPVVKKLILKIALQ